MSKKMDPVPNFKNHSLKKFSEELTYKSATPGGGSASALAGAMAASLNSMVIQYSLGKNPSLKSLFSKTEHLRKTLLNLVEKDSLAYEKLRKAGKLKKNIESATRYAADIPMQTAKLSYENLRIAEILVNKGNPRLASDIGVAGLLSYAAIHGALLNVLINVSGLKKSERIKKVKLTKQLIKKAKTNTISLLNFIEHKLC